MAARVSEPGTPTRFGGGATVGGESPALGAALVGGVRRHPILGPAFDTAANLFGYDRARLQALEDSIGTETASEKIAGLVGELGPDFIVGGAIYGLGRTAGLKALQAAATGRSAGQLGLVAVRAARDAEIAAGRLGAVKALPTAWSEVLSKAVGGQTALAGYVGGSEYLRTGNTRDALEAAGLSAVIGGVLEGVPTGLGALTGRARAARLDQEALRAKAITTGAEKLIGRLETTVIPSRTNKLAELTDQLDTFLNVQQTSGNLVQRGALESALETLPTQIKQAERRLAESETLLTATRGFIEESGAALLATTNQPFMPKGFKRTFLQVSRNVARTPESLWGSQGATARKFWAGVQNAEMATNLAVTTWDEQVRQLRTHAFKTLGLNPHARDAQQREVMWRVIHEFEKRSPTGTPQTPEEAYRSMVGFLTNPPAEWASRFPHKVTQQQAEEFANTVLLGHQYQRSLGEKVASVGGEPFLTPADHASLRTSHYWTHISDPNLDDAQQYARLTEYFGGDEVAAARSMKAAEGEGWLASQRTKLEEGPTRTVARRIGKFGAHDYARSVPGTGWEKLKAGLPINDDPFDSMSRYLKAAERRYHFAKVVGPKGELVEVVQQAVAKEVEAAARAAGMTSPRAEGIEMANFFKNMADEMLDHKYYAEGTVKLTRMVTSMNVASKLALGVFAQLTQPGNTMFLTGARATLKGFRDLVNREKSADARLALAIPHMASRATAGMLDAGAYQQLSERMAETVLRYTGFEPAEKLLRVHAFHSGNAIFRDRLVKAAAGKLRGDHLDHAYRLMADLGVDLQSEVGALQRLGPRAYFNDPRVGDLIERVGYRTAQRTQFVPSKSRKPLLWDTPLGRVLFQFKTFALGQARLVKDSVLAEAASGNLKPLAYWMSLTPLSGAFIVGAKNLFRDKPMEFTDHPVGQVAQLFMSAGGFGLAGEMFYSALNGNLANMALGPTAAQVIDWMEAATQQDTDALLRSGAQLPLVRLGSRFFGAMGAGYEMTDDLVDEYLRATEEGGRAVVDLGQAGFLETLRKGGGKL